MSPFLPLAVAVLAGVLAIGLTWVVRRWALGRALLDRPGARSSHTVPTPRGGGLAIAAVILGSTVALGLARVVDPNVVIALVGGGLLVAASGWLDDLRGLKPAVRAAGHFIAAAWAVFWLGGLPLLELGFADVPLGPAGFLLAMLGIVWSINLYNFMDGIDGLAAVEAVTVGLGAGALLFALGAMDLALLGFLTAGASAGFLAWNWPPARIFMGDVGSALLGFIFPVLALASENRGSLPIAVWIMLLGVFVLDSTITLVRRALKGEPVHQPHARHAYQRATRFYGSHKRVTVAVLLLNLALAGAALLAVALPHLLFIVFIATAAALYILYAQVERLNPMWAGR
jgi:Fuc2NAc and GlcNAc transferase